MKNEILKSIFKYTTPPIILKMVHMLQPSSKYGFHGNYKTWEQAKNASSGYDAKAILEKVKLASLKVKENENTYERDSVLFSEPQYSWPVLAALLWIASRNKGILNVLDFGGSLGSSYFCMKKFLSKLDGFTWSIVEQHHFADCGKQLFENEVLKFYKDIKVCIGKQAPTVFHCSAVLQYLEKPYDLLNELFFHKIPFLLFDRTPFMLSDKDSLTIQKVPPSIYKASYPAWFFSRERFLGVLEKRYSLIAEWDSQDASNIPATFKGFLFERR
jgi:putative methyltransferase (TIGR04325 family)